MRVLCDVRYGRFVAMQCSLCGRVVCGTEMVYVATRACMVLVVSGTEIAYGASCLYARCAMSGTEIGYGARNPMRCP
eukprot:1085649-Rhodomonas_salina.1